jgi:hypothetical protein
MGQRETRFTASRARLTEVGRAFFPRRKRDVSRHAKTTALAYGKRGWLPLAASEDAATGTLIENYII